MKKYLILLVIPLLFFVFTACSTTPVEDETEIIQTEEQQAPNEKSIQQLQKLPDSQTVEVQQNTVCPYHGEQCPYGADSCPDAAHHEQHTSQSSGGGHHGEHHGNQ